MTSYSSADFIAFAEEMWGSKLTEAQKYMLREISEGRLYVSARGGGKSFLTHYLGEWIAADENIEPSRIPYTLDYDSLMNGARCNDNNQTVF